MRTTLLLQQHQKCINILEMIERVDGYLFTKKRGLETFLSYPPNIRWKKYIMTRESDFTDFIERFEAVRNRLIHYYENQFMKIELQIKSTVVAVL